MVEKIIIGVLKIIPYIVVLNLIQPLARPFDDECTDDCENCPFLDEEYHKVENKTENGNTEAKDEQI